MFLLSNIKCPCRAIALWLICSMFCLFFSVGAQAAAGPPELHWAWGSTDCSLPGGDTMACGGFGNYVFSDRLLRAISCGGGSGSSHGSSEVPQSVPETSIPMPLIGWVPCASGMCFTATPSPPWVAVIDWPGLHGWSVGHLIEKASGGRAETKLYSLEDGLPAAVAALPGVGDAHVLAQLCAVADEAQDAPHLAPSIVNMSFGRVASGIGGACGSGLSLGCEIEELMAYMRTEYDIQFVAGAGNDGEMLFPASSAETMAVGGVNTAHWLETGEFIESSHSPAGVDAIFPAKGIILESGSGDAWPAPPGTSYASAIASGWLAGYLDRYPSRRGSIFNLSTSSLLRPRSTFDGFLLSRGSFEYPGSATASTSRLLGMAAGEHSHVWWPLLDSSDVDLVTVRDTAVTLPSESWSHAASNSFDPLPIDVPCVPCADPGNDGPPPVIEGVSAPTLILKGDTNDPNPIDVPCVPCEFPNVSASPDKALPIVASSSMFIDMSWGRGLTAGIELQAVYLEVGDTVHRFWQSGSELFLWRLQHGHVRRLQIQNPPTIGAGQETSLIWILNDGSGSYYHRTPILMLDLPEDAPLS